jgi:hypothetical protein
VGLKFSQPYTAMAIRGLQQPLAGGIGEKINAHFLHRRPNVGPQSGVNPIRIQEIQGLRQLVTTPTNAIQLHTPRRQRGEPLPHCGPGYAEQVRQICAGMQPAIGQLRQQLPIGVS